MKYYVLVRRYDKDHTDIAVNVDLFTSKEAAIKQMRIEYEKRIELNNHFESICKNVGEIFIDQKYDPSNIHHLAEAIIVVWDKGEQDFEGTVQWDVFEVVPDKVMTNDEKETVTTLSETMDNDMRCRLDMMMKMISRVRKGDTVKFGQYPQTGNGDVLPVEWKILEIKDDKALLLSKHILDCHRYDQRKINCETTWVDSELRTWLNSYFYDKAFSDLEKEAIIDSPVRGTKSVDKVFILNSHQADIMFRNHSNEYFNYQELRVKTITEYAKKKCRLLHEDATSIFGDVVITAEDIKQLHNNCWWLRTSYKNINIDGKNQICIITPEGYLGCTHEDSADVGVCPAIWVETAHLKR